MTDRDWVRGDLQGVEIPAHADALLAGGARFLTAAFRAAGTIAPDNDVRAIVNFEKLSVGGTGHKLLLTVDYERPSPELHRRLFVKFSRNFEDPILDYSKHDLEPEIRLAMISRAPDFPGAVAPYLFGDFHQQSGTGLLITGCIPFGEGEIEPQHPKCLDYRMPDPLGHYEALVTALARLAGMQRSGRLPEMNRHFPLDVPKLLASDRIPYSIDKMSNRVARYAQFAADFPQLLPANIRSPAFLDRLAVEVPRLMEQEEAIRRHLHADRDFIALCHWNANADNAWFWRESGAQHCGLIDWGQVGQMQVALALWGCLSGAETVMLDEELDGLMMLFAEEYRRFGGPRLDPDELGRHFTIGSVMRGLAYLMDAPPRIKADIPDLAEAENRFDPRFEAKENARVQLLMMTNFLNLWETRDPMGIVEGWLGSS